MLKSKTRNGIDIIMNELIEKTIPIFGGKLKKVVLYGSYARGDFDEESDILKMLKNKSQMQNFSWIW